jgi:hypothetical protein
MIASGVEYVGSGAKQVVETTENMVMSALGQHDDFELDDDLEDGPKLKVDGAFGQIFGSDDADLEQLVYMVEDYYWTTGCAQRIARSEKFIQCTLAVISANAVYIGIDSDWNNASTLYTAHPFFIIFDNFFCGFFFLELLTRFLAFECKRNCLRDGWFRFDLVLVVLMVAETWILAPIFHAFGSSANVPVEPLRLMRLLRLTRMARLMKSFPEIVTMTKGLAIAARSMCSALAISVLLIYLFAIIMHMALKEEDAFNEKMIDELNGRNFATVSWCMWTLLLDGTFMMDGAAIISTVLLDTGGVKLTCACFVFMVFMLISALTVMNMLIGVICRVVNAVGEGEIDNAAINLVKESILMDLKNFDVDNNGMITREELAHVMCDTKSKRVLKSLNVDRLFLLEMQKMLFAKPGKEDTGVPIKKIVELMLMCRGNLPTTVQALASGVSYLALELHELEDRLAGQLKNMEALSIAVSRMCTRMSNSMDKRSADRGVVPGRITGDALIETTTRSEKCHGFFCESLFQNRKQMASLTL